MLLANKGLKWHQGPFITVTKATSMWFFEGLFFLPHPPVWRLQVTYSTEDTYYSQDLQLSLDFLFHYCSVCSLNKTPNVWPVLPELEDCSQFSS